MLVVEKFQDSILKKVSKVPREFGKNLIFVEFVDRQSFESSGDMILLKDDVNLSELESMLLKPIKATLQVGSYNGRASVACTNIELLKS